MSSITQEFTPARRDRSRSPEARQRTLQRRVIRFEKYGTDTRKGR